MNNVELSNIVVASKDEAYSPVKHLASALLLNTAKGNRLMAMLTGYFDASGATKVQKVFGIAGYISTVDKWVAFETQWRKVLEEFNLPAFHLTDFINGKNRYYRNMSDRDKTRLINKLLVIMRRCCTHPVGAFFYKSDYDMAHAKVVRKGLRVPYDVTAAMICLVGINDLADRCNYIEPIVSIFEQDDIDVANVHQTHRLIRREYQEAEFPRAYRSGGFAFKSKQEFTPLQSADMLTYTGRRWHSGALSELYKERLGKLLDNNLDMMFLSIEELKTAISWIASVAPICHTADSRHTLGQPDDS
jgi:hypothetical protein